MASASVGSSTSYPADYSSLEATKMAADPSASDSPGAQPSSPDPAKPSDLFGLPEYPPLSVGQSVAASKLRRDSIKMLQTLMERSPLGTPAQSDDEADQNEKQDQSAPVHHHLRSPDPDLLHIGSHQEPSPLKAALDGMRSPSPREDSMEDSEEES